ncbi:MAG: hypothetical protein ACOYU2_06345 [Nitrospirota bacterium]
MRKLMFLAIFWAIVLSVSIFVFDSHAKPPKQMELDNDSEQDAISVQVDGVGTLKDDVAAARKIAISDGLRIAVEQAKGIMVKGETEVRDFAEIRDEVVSKTKGFVRTYKILNETKEDNIYRVTLEVEVMLKNPKETAPVKMDEQKYNTKIPKLVEETNSLVRKTNQIADALRSRRHGSVSVDEVKRLHQRYVVMLQVIESIEPPGGKKEKMQILSKALRLKMRAMAIFGRAIAGVERPMLLKRGFDLNNRGNRVLKEFQSGVGLKWGSDNA